MRATLVGLGLVLLTAPTAGAQLQVTGSRDLVFGWVVPGVNKHIAPSDPTRSGIFDVVAAQGNKLQVDFTLPNRLNGPAGAQLNLNFANGDAIALETGPGATPVSFNPKNKKNFTLTTGNRLLVFLGGTAQPKNNQAPGLYTATVTLTVTVK